MDTELLYNNFMEKYSDYPKKLAELIARQKTILSKRQKQQPTILEQCKRTRTSAYRKILL